MITVACQCDGLPAHDHYMGQEWRDGGMSPKYDLDDIGRVWVNWKAVARALMEAP